MNIQELEQRINKDRQGIDFNKLEQELKETEAKLQTPEVWANQNLASELGQKSREINLSRSIVHFTFTILNSFLISEDCNNSIIIIVEKRISV